MYEDISQSIAQNFGSITILFTAFTALIYTIIEFITKKRTKTEYLKSFEQTVNQLASTNFESQLSAAILMRRFLNIKIWLKPFLFDETINVMSSLLRTLPTGIYQKTLCDGLAYAGGKGLSNKDFQKTNLQNIYLGNKNHKILCHHTDFYMADFSYALLENIKANEAIFYNAIFMSANIKNCTLRNANFMGADLTYTYFKNVILEGANFTNAINIPQEIKDNLKDGIYTLAEPVTTTRTYKGKRIFFSMPGVMTKNEELITKAYKEILEKMDYEVICYEKDHYPKYGQLNRVRKSIMSSSGMIAFGFKQLNIINGIYRPETPNEELYNNKWHSTPWSEIEVGMATMSGIPILLVHDKEIVNGVFDELLSEHFVGKICADADIRKIETNTIFQSWIEIVRKLH